MVRGKEARRLVGVVVLGSVGLGCVGPGYHLLGGQAGPRPSDPPAPSHVTADARPVPELRIPGPTPEQPTSPGPAVTTPPLAPATALVQAAPRPDDTSRLRRLHEEAAARFARIDSYIVRLRRREQVNGQDKPEEVLLFKFRKQPWSVYFKWLGAEGKGREVVYVKGRYEDKIHTLLAAGDVPFLAGGRRFAVSPDSPFVRSNSRHTIHEAGLGVLIDRFGELVAGHGPGSAQYLGPLKRPEFETPCEGVEQTIPPGSDPLLPRGGSRLWAFDPLTKLPVLVVTRNETGHEVEYYCYDRFQYPVKLDDDDFNPDKLWPAKPERPPGK